MTGLFKPPESKLKYFGNHEKNGGEHEFIVYCLCSLNGCKFV